jgi:phosphopantetheine--protein transferase-like protein
MQEKLKEIVSVFIKVPPGEIGPATPIDRFAVGNSILLHRMYARLAQEGIAPEDYSVIKVFGDLRPGGFPASAATTPAATSGHESAASPVAIYPPAATTQMAYGPAADRTGTVGIDIEETAAMPRATDFRKEEFYILNFSPWEIAYCILQPDPYASFAGLFAVKEAIVKAGGRRPGEPFHSIQITHTAQGKPEYADFAISISHTQGLAVAVAVRPGDEPVRPAITGPAAVAPQQNSSWVAWTALLLGVIALLVALIHRA